jgi:hypothetical protein
MSNRATSSRIECPESAADAMHEPALAEFGSEREMSQREKTVANTKSTPVTAPLRNVRNVRKRRKTDWVGIFALVFGLLLAAVCLYSALTDPRRTSDAGGAPQPITSRSQNPNR